MTTRSPWILVLAFVLAIDPSATRAAQKHSAKAPKPETHAAPAKASQAHPADHGKHPEKKAPAADSHAKFGSKPAGKHVESHAAPVGHGTAKHGEHGTGKDHSEPPAKEPDIDATLDQFVREGMGKSFRPAQPKPRTVDELKLESTEEFIDNTNLVKHVDKPSKTNEVWEIRRHWFALRSARELRQGADPQQAILILVSLLEALDTPTEVKGQALYELGLAAQQAGKTPRAFQIFSQFVHRFSEDPRVPEALYRQGVLQREMGAKQLALSKFYSVLSTSLKLKDGQFGDYEELVLKAQTEIADTHFAFGDYELAGDFYQRLLRLKTERLDKGLIHYKRVRALWRHGDTGKLILAAREFISARPTHPEAPEVRFLLANSLKKMGRNKQALEEVLGLLKSQQSLSTSNPGKWMYWQQRTGNSIANELYQEGDYLSALEIYLNLATLNGSASWQLPVWYQTGLVYERLQSPQKAGEIYARIVGRKAELGEQPSASLKTIVEMAEWRGNFLNWQVKAERDTGKLLSAMPGKLTLPAAPEPEPKDKQE